MRKKVVAVIGGRACDKEVGLLSIKLGKALAKVVDTIVTGGLGGVMEAVCKGFKGAKGKLVIGIIPGYKKEEANP